MLPQSVPRIANRGLAEKEPAPELPCSEMPDSPRAHSVRRLKSRSELGFDESI
jgi:hypothetical protein